MKIYIAILIAFLALIGWGFYERSSKLVIEQQLTVEQNKVKTLEDANKNLSTQLRVQKNINQIFQTVVESNKVELQKLEKQNEINKRKLEKALQSEPDWSNTRIPDSVRDALRSGETSPNVPSK